MMDLGQEEIRVTGRSSPCRSASPWEGVYEAKGEDQLSWRQEEPTLSLEVVESRREVHRTPWGSEQAFVHAALRRATAGGR